MICEAVKTHLHAFLSAVRHEGSGEFQALGSSLLKKETWVSNDRSLDQAQIKPECDGGKEQFPTPP